MAELNEAWRVLSDPARRAVYDASLRPSRPADEGRSGYDDRYARAASPFRQARRPGDPGPLRGSSRPEVDAVLRHGRPLVSGITWMLLLGVLLAIFLVSAYAGSRRESVPPGIDGFLTVGSCVVVPPIDQPAQEVPCDGSPDGIVVTFVPVGQSCPTRLRSALTPDRMQTVCFRDP